MFINGIHNFKTSFYAHVDVYSKLVIGYSFRDKSYDEVQAEEPFEEQRAGATSTRANNNRGRFEEEMEADRYEEYVAMGWREPEPQDIGRVVLNRNFKRTETNLALAREILKRANLCRHGGESLNSLSFVGNAPSLSEVG